MIGYSGTELFREDEINLWRAATEAIARLDYKAMPRTIRCHELARAVAALPVPELLSIAIQDGTYGAVDHSWIRVWHPRRKAYDLLDVYCVGRLPMVQLLTLDVGPMHGALYRAGPPRNDIDLLQVSTLTAKLRVTWPFGKDREAAEERLQREVEVNDSIHAEDLDE